MKQPAHMNTVVFKWYWRTFEGYTPWPIRIPANVYVLDSPTTVYVWRLGQDNANLWGMDSAEVEFVKRYCV